MAEIKVKGFIIGKTLEMARREMDEQAFAALEDELGVTLRDLKLAFFRDYPVDLQLRAEELVSMPVFGADYDTAVYSIGRLNFISFRESAIGRTSMAMIGNNPVKVVRATLRLISTVMSGLQIDVEERSEQEFSLRFRNAPHRPLGWKGIIDAALEHCGVSPEVRIVNHGVNDYEFIVTW